MRTLPLLLAFAAASVSAASPNVGVVDVADVMSKYTKAIEIKGGIDQSLAQSKAQVEQKGKELEALKADFDKTVKDANNPMLNESGKKAAVGEAQAKQQNLQQRFNEYQQFVQQAQASIQARAGELEKPSWPTSRPPPRRSPRKRVSSSSSPRPSPSSPTTPSTSPPTSSRS